MLVNKTLQRLQINQSINQLSVITIILYFFGMSYNFFTELATACTTASSETQGQIVEAREGLNGRKNIHGTKKSKERREEPLGTMSYQTSSNGRRRSGFWLVPENFCVFLPNQKPEWWRPFGTCLVRHCPQGLFLPFFTFLCAIFFRPFRLSLAPIICPWVSEDVW